MIAKNGLEGVYVDKIDPTAFPLRFYRDNGNITFSTKDFKTYLSGLVGMSLKNQVYCFTLGVLK